MARLSGEHLSVNLPPGWDGRIYRRPAVALETTHAVLHLGNFGLPADAADYGNGAVQLMGRSQVFVALVEFHPSSTGAALFATPGRALPLRPEQASRTTLQRAIGGQAGIQQFFTESQRAWCLYVVLGSYEDRVRLVRIASDVVGRIAIEPASSGAEVSSPEAIAARDSPGNAATASPPLRSHSGGFPSRIGRSR